MCNETVLSTAPTATSQYNTYEYCQFYLLTDVYKNTTIPKFTTR